MAHFSDKEILPKDIEYFIKRVHQQVSDARRRYVNAYIGLKGLYEMCEDPSHAIAVENSMARLAHIIDAIDGKVKPQVELDDDEIIGLITQSHIDRWLNDDAE